MRVKNQTFEIIHHTKSIYHITSQVVAALYSNLLIYWMWRPDCGAAVQKVVKIKKNLVFPTGDCDLYSVNRFFSLFLLEQLCEFVIGDTIHRVEYRLDVKLLHLSSLILSKHTYLSMCTWWGHFRPGRKPLLSQMLLTNSTSSSWPFVRYFFSEQKSLYFVCWLCLLFDLSVRVQIKNWRMSLTNWPSLLHGTAPSLKKWPWKNRRTTQSFPSCLAEITSATTSASSQWSSSSVRHWKTLLHKFRFWIYLASSLIWAYMSGEV